MSIDPCEELSLEDCTACKAPMGIQCVAICKHGDTCKRNAIDGVDMCLVHFMSTDFAIRSVHDKLIVEDRVKKSTHISDDKKRDYIRKLVRTRPTLPTDVLSNILNLSRQDDSLYEATNYEKLLKTVQYNSVIQTLVLDPLTTTDDTIHMISVRFSGIITLNMTGCKKVTEQGLEHLRKLKKLEHLQLTNCTQITDNHLLSIAKIKSLKSLDLSHCRSITDLGIGYLKSLVRIKKLNFTNCNQITGIGLSTLVSKKKNPLRWLCLSECTSIDDDGLSHVSKFTKLRYLSLKFCSRITDVGAEHISKLIHLRHLDVHLCLNLTDVGIQYLCTRLYQLVYLNIGYCHRITNETLKNMGTLPMLTRLDLSGCKQINDDGLLELSTGTTLIYLKLHGCIKITDHGLLHLSKLNTLEYLNLDHCTNITDVGIEYLARIHTLRRITTQWCTKVTVQHGKLSIH
jgi:hypothetical protein